MRDVQRQLKAYVKSTKLTSVFNTNATHVWSVDHGNCHCGYCRSIFDSDDIEYVDYDDGYCCDVNNCEYDLTFDIFTRFYGVLNAPTPDAQPLLRVNQHEHLPAGVDPAHSGMMKFGFVYVPQPCAGNFEDCVVHVHYHGCIDNNYTLRERWSNIIRLNNYGETNGIIILYPQSRGDKETGEGCWRWELNNVTRKVDPLFDTRKSIQLRTVNAMIERLSPETLDMHRSGREEIRFVT
eukprot:gene5458-6616_t